MAPLSHRTEGLLIDILGLWFHGGIGTLLREAGANFSGNFVLSVAPDVSTDRIRLSSRWPHSATTRPRSGHCSDASLAVVRARRAPCIGGPV